MDNKQTNSSFRLEASGILKIALKWWKPLILVGIISVILAVIFTSPYFIKPLFKSRAVIYPSNIAPYSSENPTEQMLQVFESEDIRDRLIKDFDLYKHYEIDSTDKYHLTTLYGTIKERISASKTEYESAELTVYDTDPLIASAICDSMISYFNNKIITMQRAKYAEVVKINWNQMERKRIEMDSMEIAMKLLRTDYGILEYGEQVKPFSKAYYKAVAEGKAGNGKNSSLDQIEKTFAEKGGEYMNLKEHLWRIRGTYNDLKIIYENSLTNLTKELTFCNVVTRPFPADKKSSPVRSLLILGYALAALFASFIIIIIIEKNRESKFS